MRDGGPLHLASREGGWPDHRDQVKGVRLVSESFSVAPLTVGAVSNRTGVRPAVTSTKNHLLWRPHQSMGSYSLAQVYTEINSLTH